MQPGGADERLGQQVPAQHPPHPADGGSVSEWGRTAMEWAVSTGLLSGYENNTLRPINGIKRCELAAVLRTFCQTMLEPTQGT